MIWPFRRKSSVKKAPSARRIVIWALIIGAIIGAVDLPRPLEDIYRGGRAWLRARPADGKTVVVAIDDRTFDRLGSGYYSRKHNADLIDRLFALGAKRVYFDEIFSVPLDKEGDSAFVEALKRHPGKVTLGAITFRAREKSQNYIYQPLPQFRAVARVRSLHTSQAPFGLSEELYYGDREGSFGAQSASADIAGVKGEANTKYRPDWSIRVSSVPTVSMLDVLEGKASQSSLSGKDVFVGITAMTQNDFAHVVGQGWFGGVYAHVIGAQTLREGRPVSIGWIPAILLTGALLILITSARTRKRRAAIVAAGLGLGVAAPFVLDAWFVTAEFLPSYIAFGIAIYRLATLREIRDAGLKNSATLMPNLAALREEVLASKRPIIAMRLRNYAAVGASFSDSVESELIGEVARRLTLPGEAACFYQAEDVLYWLGPALPMYELEGHMAGLARLMESPFLISGRKIDIHAAFGIDLDLARPVVNRIGRALLAADNAAAKHQSYLFNTSDNDEESAWELSLMSELDEAIDNGDIWIAYQPQFELKSDRIIGAEALVRWQHPVRGAISPEAFILPAEEHNRIGRLTFHVLKLATSAAHPFLATNPGFRLSVNISASLMELDGLPARIIEILGQTGFPTASLTLEVTESAPFAEHEIVAQNLKAIAALGIDLSIDDYGTGNATLEYLRSVPCQEIKIDRRFVAEIVANNGDMLLVESTIELAHGMGRRVIAEGIEDPETLELLRAIGCDIAQGYYLAKPMRIEALESLLNISARIRAA
ncbi:MAG: EAL domain-containing protein [Novosphingobium sp.]|uniref:EAL domain-containing protein n=1 Tax=Novosphingobium sp. TaxID=1874826 RepID=UPI0032B8C9F0